MQTVTKDIEFIMTARTEGGSVSITAGVGVMNWAKADDNGRDNKYCFGEYDFGG